VVAIVMMGLAVACSSAALTDARRARLSVVKRPLAPSFLEDFEIMGDQGRPWAGEPRDQASELFGNQWHR
jgi:hypothetical protein